MSTSLPEADTTLEISDEAIEQLMGEEPCENDVCENPAEFLLTHEKAEPKCTVMLCDSCTRGAQDWVAERIVQSGPRGFACARCGRANMSYRELIFRKIR